MKTLSNYFLRLILFSVLLQIQLTFLNAQTVTKTTTVYVAGTVCPVSETLYSVSIPDGFQTCTRSWTATNGAIVGSTMGTTVRVKWNDTPGVKGKITCTFTSCGNSNDNVAASLEELILSVKNQSWASYGTSVNIDYCTKAQLQIVMPRMYVQGTGGINQPPLTEVSYAWTLPGGWREVGTNRTGEFGTAANYVNIEPIDCAKPGSVTVFGTLAGAGPFCNSSEKSAIASIALNGANPVVTVGPQVGYTGGSACNTTPVTFYATTSVALGCISSYIWNHPPSWLFVSQSANSITLQPSGTSNDSNPIKATIGFSCGSSVTSGNYVPPFSTPAISGPSLLCSSGTMTLNVAPGATVNWSVSANITIVSGQGTPSISVTNAGDGGAVVGASLTNCPSTSVPNKSIWVGKPVFSTYTYDGQQTPFICEGLVQSFTGGDHVLTAIPGGTSSYPSFQLQTSSPYVRGTAVGYNYNFHVNEKNQNYQFTIRASVSNGCGTKSSCTSFSNWASIMASYPNPSDDELHVHLGKEGETKKVLLFNSNLEILFSTETTENEVIVGTATLPEGLYVLKIAAGEKIISRHLQVKH